MKKLHSITLLVTLVLSVQVVWAGQAPVTITAKSYQALIHGVKRLSEATRPGSSAKVVQGLQQSLGLSELPGVDQERPWQVAIWAETLGASPSVSVRVPVSDFAAFRDGLKNGGLLGGKAKDLPVERVGDYASIWVKHPSSTMSEATHSEWSRGELGVVGDLIEVEVALPEGLRQELLQSLSMGRMVLTGALTSQTSEQMQGIEPQALADLMGAYIDVLELGIKGLDQLSIGLDVDEEALVIRERLSATDGSELADWLEGNEANLAGVDLLPSDDAAMSMALALGSSPAFMSTLKKFTRLSLQIQGMPGDSDVTRLADKLIDSLTPLLFSANVDLGDGMNFVGSYKFPGRDPAEPYEMMKSFLRDAMQGMVGEHKVYRSIVLEEGEREVAGTRVDRLTMEMNLDAPMYRAPGQKEMIESMWPGGKMTFDYALKGERLLIGTPARLDPLLKREITKVDGEAAGWTKNTVAFGRIDVLKIIPIFLAANPMVPAEVKERFDGMETEGGDITVRVDLDGSFAAETIVPFKVFGAIGGTMGPELSEGREAQ